MRTATSALVQENHYTLCEQIDSTEVAETETERSETEILLIFEDPAHFYSRYPER